MTDINQNTTTVSQTHEGEGHNFLFVEHHDSISLEKLRNNLRDILLDLLHRKHKLVIEKVEFLKKSESLSPQLTNYLSVVKIQADIVDGKIGDDYFRQLDSIIQSSSDEEILDITTATKIILYCKQDDQSSAKALFRSIKSPGLYSRSAFYEYLSEHAELKSIYEVLPHSLCETELCAIARGCLISGNFDLAADVSGLLVRRYPSVNSRFLEAFSNVNDLIYGKCLHFWNISASSKKEIFEWADRICLLLDESQGQDARVVELAGNLCHFFYGENNNLLESCWNYISEFDRHLPNVAKSIRSVFEINPTYGDGLISEMAKAQGDQAYRKQVISSIKSSKEISLDDAIILSRYGDLESIKCWIDKGGDISSVDDFEKDYSMLELVCFSYQDSPGFDHNIRIQGEKFLAKYREKIKDINPLRLIELANKLIDANEAYLVSKFLEPHVCEEDIWPSELVRCYLNSLLISGQYKTLDDVIEKIALYERDSFVWQVVARKLEYQGDIVGAVDALNKALGKFPKSTIIYHCLLSMYERYEFSEDEFKELLSGIPEEVLEKESFQALSLLLAIAKYCDFLLAERMIINWYIKNPIRSATSVTDFYSGMLIKNITPAKISLSCGDCIGAYQYTRNNQHVTHLIVDHNLETEHDSLLKSGTPLAEVLAAGEDRMLGTNSIENIKQVPPLMAAFSIAAGIRQANNQGFDAFMQLGGPNTTAEENVKQLFKVLKSQDDRKEQISDRKIPLYMKGKFIGNGCPVQNAYDHLMSKASHKEPLPGFGEDHPESIVLDIYGILVISSTGLSAEISKNNTNIYISNETKKLIEYWLNNFHDDYGRFGVGFDGTIWMESSEEIQRKTKSIRDGVNIIINNAVVLSPKLVDMPPELMSIRRSVDMSVFSSMALSHANDIPWLCIDPMFASLWHTSNRKVVNTSSLLLVIARNISFEDRREGIYLHVATGMPRWLGFDELFELSKSDDEHAPYFLAKLLEMYPASYGNSLDEVRFYRHLLSTSLLKTLELTHPIWAGLRESNLSNNGYVEKLFYTVCRVVISSDIDKEAEYKFSCLIFGLIDIFGASERMCKLILTLATKFSRGHFLDFDSINNYLNYFYTNSEPVCGPEGGS